MIIENYKTELGEGFQIVFMKHNGMTEGKGVLMLHPNDYDKLIKKHTEDGWKCKTCGATDTDYCLCVQGY